MVCRAVKKVHDQIKASARPNLPLIWSEFNASYKNEPEITDSTYHGPVDGRYDSPVRRVGGRDVLLDFLRCL